jgi:hypothetical protein
MNPKEIRQAIIDGLAATAPFDAATMQRFRYPPGDQADAGTGVALGAIEDIEAELDDLGGGGRQVSYDLGILFWCTGDNDTDAAFAELEDTITGYVTAFEGWLADIGHGKRLSAGGGVVVDSMELVAWDLGFTLDPPAAVVEGTIEIVEFT